MTQGNSLDQCIEERAFEDRTHSWSRALTALLVACHGAFIATGARAQSETRTWVERSNELSQILVDAQAPFDPERFSFYGLARYDDQIIDLSPDREVRFRAANQAAKAALQSALQTELEPNVRQDLEIMIAAAERSIAQSALDERLRLTWHDIPELVFSSLNDLLSEQIPVERQARALPRLLRYAGLSGNTSPVTTLARHLYEKRAHVPGLLHPTRQQLERALANVESYVGGIRRLFEKVPDSESAVAALEQQLRAYATWTRGAVLPAARTDTRLPPELYAQALRSVGIDIAPRILMRRAQLEFMETRAAMQVLAPRIASDMRLATRDYRDVIRALKLEKIPNERLEQAYRAVIDAIDPIIRRERIVRLPERAVSMRLGTDAEAAAQPAPYLLTPPLWNNRGEQAQVVLTLNNPTTDGGVEAYDDFNYEAACWTLSAHEARPGHELQNISMLEQGVSFARSAFAFNSVNVEGWALYAEAELLPYEPPAAQLIALQFRLLRAARAMLDPMINLGLIERERAERVLLDEVVVSPAMARQELDRYTFGWPGQAGSYFFGYSRIMQLRIETELALGPDFDRYEFNNFVLAQGMVPLDLLARAVRERFRGTRPADTSSGSVSRREPGQPLSHRMLRD